MNELRFGARLSRRALLSAAVASSSAAALGRVPYGGTLHLTIPWPLESIDPHRLHDATAALFADALFDPLYSLDERGRPYPTLADGMPQTDHRGASVRLRPGLRTAGGTRLDARQVAWSLARARRFGAAPLLRRFPPAKPDGSDPLVLLFAGAHPAEVARSLSSPLTAIVSRSFTPTEPDGTGAFVGSFRRGSLVLTRNVRAARGPAYLDAVDIEHAAGLADALRAFETGDADVGWLGAGLHRPRAGAVALRTPALGWILLRTGAAAGAWGAPGIAQRLADTVPRRQLLHLGFQKGGPPADTPWGGPPADLLVPENSPYLIEVARVTAAALARPGHGVTVAPTSRSRIDDARRSGRFALMLDIARLLGDTPELRMLSLIASADPALARKPPSLRDASERAVTRTLTVGVLGKMVITGARDPRFHALGRWRLGGVYFAQ